MTKPVLSYANNKDADQPACSHSLIRIFVIDGLDSICLSSEAAFQLSRLLLPSVAEQTGLGITWSHTSEDVLKILSGKEIPTSIKGHNS